MKKLFFSLALILAFTASVCATPVTVSNSTQTNFNPSNLSGDVTVSVTATSGSTTVTSAALFRAAWVNLGGFRVSIGGTAYTVANVDSTSSLSLTSAFTGITGATTLTLYKYVEVRLYSSISFRPLGSSEEVQVGTPGSGSWFKRFAASVSSTLNGAVNTSGTAVTWVSGDLFSSAMAGKVVTINGTNYVISSVASSTSLTLSSSAGTQSAVAFTCNTGTSFLFIPSFTIESTTDSVDNNTARYKIGFYRPDNSLIQYYTCSSTSDLRIPPTTPTTLADVCVYNSAQVIQTTAATYTATQIDARFPSCTSGQMIYYAATGQTQNCLTVGTGLAIAGGTITATGGAGTVTGSGTANTFALWTGASSIGNGELTFDVGASAVTVANNLAAGKNLTLGNNDFILNGNPARTVGVIQMTLKGVLGQTGDYLRMNTSAGALKFAVDVDGDIYPRGVVLDWPNVSGNGVLANDGLGGLSWSTLGSLGGITGSGTVNKIPIYLGATTIGDSPISYNSGITTTLITGSLAVEKSFSLGTDQFVANGDIGRAASTVMLTLKGVVSQSGDYIRVNDVTNSAVFLVDKDGDIYPRAVPYAWPGANAAGVLTNDSAGNLTWTPASGGTPGGSSGNIQWNNAAAFAGMAGSTVTTLGYLTLAPTASTSGSPTPWVFTGPAHTTLAADTEAVDLNFNLNRTVQFTAGGGTFSIQRGAVFNPPTYAFTSADTITASATVAISGAPVAGTNATLSNKYSLWVQAGMSNFDDVVNIGTGSSLASDDYLLFPFIGGTNSSGPAIRWGSSASYGSQSSLFLSNGFTFQGANSTHDPVKIRTGTGTSSDGTLVFEFRPSSGIFNATPQAGVTSSRHEIFNLDITSTGTPGAGFGGQVNYKGESSTTNSQPMASLNWLWEDATHASRRGVLMFQTVDNAGSLTERMRVNSTGIRLAAVTNANLGTPTDGSFAFCSDCTVADPCAGGGTGALAKRLNGAWVCN